MRVPGLKPLGTAPLFDLMVRGETRAVVGGNCDALSNGTGSEHIIADEDITAVQGEPGLVCVRE